MCDKISLLILIAVLLIIFPENIPGWDVFTNDDYDDAIKDTEISELSTSSDPSTLPYAVLSSLVQNNSSATSTEPNGVINKSLSMENPNTHINEVPVTESIITTSSTTTAIPSTATAKSSDEKPYFLIKYRNQYEYYNVNINETLELNCSADADGHPHLSYKWYKDKHSQSEYTNKTVWLMERVTQDKSANYTCEVCNKRPNCITRTFTVTILGPKYEKKCVGDSINIICARYQENPLIKWYRGYYNKSDQISVQSVNLSSMDYIHSIQNVTLNDTDWYSCQTPNSDNESSEFMQVYLEVSDGTECKSFENTEMKNNNLNSFLVISIIALLLVLFILVAVYAFITKKSSDEKDAELMELKKLIRRQIVIEERERDYEDDPLNAFDVVIHEYDEENSMYNYDTTSTYLSYEIMIDEEWEFPRERIRLLKAIGQGAFGKVYKAEADDIIEPNVTTTVAVKKLKEYNNENVKSFVTEMHIMKLIGKHENIVTLLKCCHRGGEFLAIMEYVGNGCLSSFLQQCYKGNDFNPLGGYNEETASLKFCYQIARGMEYLASKKFIHRDLAARNILVSDDYVMKIADFGLARNISAKDYYRQQSEGLIPYRWMAPEALTRMYNTTQSDVWSFGVVMWEIYTMGEIPYPTIPYQNMHKELKNGKRLNKPEHCSFLTYLLMNECWSYEPEVRPTFSDIAEHLKKLINYNKSLSSQCDE